MEQSYFDLFIDANIQNSTKLSSNVGGMTDAKDVKKHILNNVVKSYLSFEQNFENVLKELTAHNGGTFQEFDNTSTSDDWNDESSKAYRAYLNEQNNF